MNSPRSISDWLEAELDKKLATFATDQEKYRHLIVCLSSWSRKYQRFEDLGEQPFNRPHPEFGDMDAFAFRILIADIERRMDALVRGDDRYHWNEPA